MGTEEDSAAGAAKAATGAVRPGGAGADGTRAILESAPTLAGAPETGPAPDPAAAALLATLEPIPGAGPGPGPGPGSGDESRIHVAHRAEPEVPARVGRYVVLRQLGAGGMGVVYSAYDPELDRKVAVKVVRDGAVHRSAGRERVLQEAQAMARVSHPNVVHVYEVGEEPEAQGGRVFIAMEYVPGTSLHSHQQAHPPRDPASLDACLRLYLQAAAGLAAAHDCGLIHRDFKPDNVLVGEDGRVRVLDFGLARALSTTVAGAGASERASAAADGAPRPLPGASFGGSGGGSRQRLTQAGAIMGTPGYMAPEQVVGGEADARSDQFSFCAALYEALYGTLPFPVTSWEEFAKTAAQARLPATLPRPQSGIEVPTVIERVLRRGLSRDPAQRFASMAALSAALEQGLRPDADSETTRRIKRRALLWCCGVIVLAILVRRILSGRHDLPNLSGGVVIAWAQLLAYVVSLIVARSLIRRQPAYRQFMYFGGVLLSFIGVSRTVAWLANIAPNYYMLIELTGVAAILAYDLPTAGRRQLISILACIVAMPLQIYFFDYRIIHINIAYFLVIYVSGYLRLNSIAREEGL